MQFTLEMDDWMTAAGVLAADALDALGPRPVHLLPRGHPRRHRRVALLYLGDRRLKATCWNLGITCVTRCYRCMALKTLFLI